MFRTNDLAVGNQLTKVTATTSDGEERPVPRIFATPDRALARWNEIMTERGAEHIPLPFISIMRMDPELQQVRWRAGNVRHAGRTTDKRGAISPRFFQVHHLSYQIDIWMEQDRHVREIVTQFLRKFDPVYRMTVDYGEWGEWPQLVRNNGLSDNSDIEPGEGQERYYRKTLTVETEARLYPEAPYELTPTVLVFDIDHLLGSEEKVVEELETQHIAYDREL